MAQLRMSAAFPLLLLAGCASVPRGPAATLADAGMSATSAFATDVRDLSTRLARGDVADAFTRTWELCQNPNASLCTVQQPGGEVRQARDQLVATIELRAQALDALHRAYTALKTEAEYDERADLVGAVDQAVTAVNSYASAVAALAGAGPAGALVSQPLAAAVSFGAGLLADRRQRRRILAANGAIGTVTAKLRDALQVEAAVFESIITAVIEERTAAQRALLQAGLVSGAESIKPLITDLDMIAAKDADATIGRSPPARAAVEAALQASERADVAALRTRYRAAVGALNELVDMHAELARERPVDITDVTRFIAELDAALNAALAKPEEE
jgi:hypothetical protein